MFQAWSHVMLYATDIRRAVDFYQRVLNFEELFVAPGAYASLQHPESGTRLDLHQAPKGEAGRTCVGHGPVPYFSVVDLDMAIAALHSLGINCDPPRSEGGPRFSSFRDSEGNILGFEELAPEE